MRFSPVLLHIPDGIINIMISIFFWIVTIVIIGIAVQRSQTSLQQKQIPLMGIMGAFIFAAQMINFPVAGGTSGHLLGGALGAIILGPWPGILVMSSVIGLQALLFQDGGLVVMGVNIFNMGLITSLIGYGLYATVINSQNKRLQTGIIGFAAWLSVMASALATSIQIWLSGISPARIVFPAMLSIHALIGVGEALITVAAYSFIRQVRPDIINKKEGNSKTNHAWIVIGGIISLGVVLLSPFASTNPDGFEKVAIELGFSELTQNSSFNLLANYIVPTIGDSNLSTILAGVIGISIVGIVIYLIAQIIKTFSTERQS